MTSQIGSVLAEDENHQEHRQKDDERHTAGFMC